MMVPIELDCVALRCVALRCRTTGTAWIGVSQQPKETRRKEAMSKLNPLTEVKPSHGRTHRSTKQINMTKVNKTHVDCGRRSDLFPLGLSRFENGHCRHRHRAKTARGGKMAAARDFNTMRSALTVKSGLQTDRRHDVSRWQTQTRKNCWTTEQKRPDWIQASHLTTSRVPANWLARSTSNILKKEDWFALREPIDDGNGWTKVKAATTRIRK